MTEFEMKGFYHPALRKSLNSRSISPHECKKSGSWAPALQRETAERVGHSAVSGQPHLFCWASFLRKPLFQRSARIRASLLLLLVAVQAVDGSDGAEKSVRFALNAGGEEQCGRRAGGGVVAKRDHPQAVNGHDGVIGIFQEGDEFAGEAVERGDFPASEIADEDGIAVFAEVARSPDNAPGRIHPRAVLKVANELARRSEEEHVSEPVAGNVIMPCGVLLCVSDEEGPPDVLNVERREAWKDVVIVEPLRAKTHLVEICVVDLDASFAEICDVQKTSAVDVGGGGAFVNGSVRRAILGIVYHEHGTGAAIPSGDGAVFRGKDESSGVAVGEDEVRAAVKNRAGGSCGGAGRSVFGWRDGHDQRATSVFRWEWIPLAVVERGEAGIVVRDPPWAAAAAAEAPGV